MGNKCTNKAITEPESSVNVFQEQQSPKKQSLCCETKINQPLDNLNLVGRTIFYKLRILNENSNVVISPFSIYKCLSLAANGATEDLDAWQKFLGEDFVQYCQDLNVFSDVDDVTFTCANSVWAKDPLNPEYASEAQALFDAKVAQLTTAELINTWCSDKTQGMIDQIFSDLTPEMMVVLVNATYFKAMWAQEFDPDQSSEETFNGYGGVSSDCLMMKNYDAWFRFYEDEKCEVISMPYVDKQFDLLIVLPKDGNTLSDYHFFDVAVSSFDESAEHTNLEVFLPRFKAEWESDLQEFLPGFSIPRVSPGARISTAVHKCIIEVSELGTRAAAFTAIECSGCDADSDLELPKFHADRPFLYVLRHKTRPLFVGQLLKPDSNFEGDF